MKRKGYAGFNKLVANGKPIIRLATSAGVLYYAHIRMGGKHACLRCGDWCWKNALENPLLAIQYLIRKFQKYEK